jgi:O-antigen/teichoic acid export membrane protein
MPSTLKHKAVKGVSWNLIEKFGVQGSRFVFGIVLARLLTPKDYGLVGMMMVFFAVANVFIESGLGQSYVQKENVTELDTNTIFFSNFGISIIVYTVLWFAAPSIADFYEQPILLKLTRVMGVVVLINAFNIIQMAQVRRRLDYKRKTKISLFSNIASGIAGIVAAFYGLGVWALIIKHLSNSLIMTLSLWITNKWSPKLQFSLHSFKTLFSFGGWILLVNVINRIFDNIYALIIGKFFPAAQLGFYTKAKSFQKMSSKQISTSVSSVAFPVFSKWQSYPRKVTKGLEQFLRSTYFIIIPILVILFVVAEPFIIILLTEKWAPAIPYLRLFCIFGFFYPINSINHELLLAMGKSRVNFHLNLITHFLRILNILITFRFGVFYIIVGEILTSIISFAVMTSYNKRFTKLSSIGQLLAFKEIIIIGLVSLGIGLLVLNFINSMWIKLFAGIISTLTIYLILQLIFNRKTIKEFLDFKKILFNNRIKKAKNAT